MTRAGTDRIRNETINIRVKPRQRDVIDRAAQALNRLPADNPRLRKLLQTPAPWDK